MFGTFCLATSICCGGHSDWFPGFSGFSCLFREIEFRLR